MLPFKGGHGLQWLDRQVVCVKVTCTVHLLFYLLPIVHPVDQCSTGKRVHAPRNPHDMKENVIHQIRPLLCGPVQMLMLRRRK